MSESLTYYLQRYWKFYFASSIGTAIEFYDYSLYGYFATVFAHLFFPKQSEVSAVLSVFAIFAAGYITRPLGGLLWGHFADTKGRRKILILSVLFMGGATTLLGCLPTYATAGVWATILLLLIRIIQGLSVGGEFMDSAVYLVEQAPKKWRGSIGALVFCAGLIGFLVASLVTLAVTTVFTSVQVHAWAWRIPFLFASVTLVIGVLIRLKLSESPRFEQLKAQRKLLKLPIKEAFMSQKLAMLKCFLLIWFESLAFYLVMVFLTNWQVAFGKVNLHKSMEIICVLLLVGGIVQFVSGVFSDLLGRRRVILTGLLLSFLFVTPIFWGMLKLLQMDVSMWWLLLLQIPLFMIITFYAGPLPTLMVELFTAQSCCTALSVSYNVAAGIFGGLTPLVCTWLIKSTGVKISPAYYMTAVGLVVTVIMIFSLQESYKEPLSE